MFPELKDVILAKKIAIYNNQAQIGSCEGRLLVELYVYPKPTLKWEFEVLDPKELFPTDFPTVTRTLNKDSFEGHRVKIERISVQANPFSAPGRLSAIGTANSLFWGEPEKPAQYFEFHLTNTRFFTETEVTDTLMGTTSESRHVSKEISTFEGGVREHKPIGKFIEFLLDEHWKFRLEINNEAIEWLKPKNGNFATLLTCKGSLSQVHPENSNFSISESLSFSLLEVKQKIIDLCWLLSFANCGFIVPVSIRGSGLANVGGQGHRVMQTTCSMIQTNYQVSSLESLGCSWIQESNLKIFCECFNSFQRMLKKTFWKQTFYFVMIQYFQAARHGNWEVCISAISSALERLSYVILVEEAADSTQRERTELLFKLNKGSDQKKFQSYWKKNGFEKYSPSVIRLSCLLKHIGLEEDSDPKVVAAFQHVRNNAVHPIQDEINESKCWQMVDRGIQWVDETLLWRLGYNGKYHDRISLIRRQFPLSEADRNCSRSSATKPRYDLSTRHPDW